jgi:hypothetical protein
MHYALVCRPFVRTLNSFPSSELIVVSVLLNDHTIYEHILSDDIFPGVVGMLECEQK